MHSKDVCPGDRLCYTSTCPVQVSHPTGPREIHAYAVAAETVSEIPVQRNTLLEKPIFGALSLLLISALIYVPYLAQVGYRFDDWYLMYAAHTRGPQVFVDIFQEDRPARALVMIPAYRLFGESALYYNLSAYLLHYIAALAFWWALRMLWPRQGTATFLAALLFLIYPGFLSQVNGIDYQSHMAALAAAMLSIALSFRATCAQGPLKRGAWMVPAILLGWLYLGLMEYFIGLDVLRFGGLALLASRKAATFRETMSRAGPELLPYLVIPAFFLIWRAFFFRAERQATDIGEQLAGFMGSPVQTAAAWLFLLAKDVWNVTVLAWGAPLMQLFRQLALRDLLLAGAAILLAGGLLWLMLRTPSRADATAEKRHPDWRGEALGLGLLAVLLAQLPVTMANRQVDFIDFSRYALPGSAGASLITVALLYSLRNTRLRWAAVLTLLSIAMFSHHANTLKAARETAALRDFWWQVVWRAPGIENGTTFVADYAEGSIQEDYFVWGPASFIFYPRSTSSAFAAPAFAAALFTDQDTLVNKLAVQKTEPEQRNRRSIHTTTRHDQILILSNPAATSCVHAIDGHQPELSALEDPRLILIAHYSRLERILPDQEPAAPPEHIFGPEPAHSWCYFYQKASLARQKGDWQTVRSLGKEAFQGDFSPADPIEWMPFLQAYALDGDTARLKQIAPELQKIPFVRQQACQILAGIEPLHLEVRAAIQQLYCRGPTE